MLWSVSLLLFFKHKSAYELRIRDCSSDVCSSDLTSVTLYYRRYFIGKVSIMLRYPNFDPIAVHIGPLAVHWYGLMYLVGFALAWEIGRASCRERVCQYV